MPFLYLSPSTREYSEYITTGTEASWMNAVVDAMVPYLRASAVNFVRSREQTAADTVRQSNAGAYDFYLALRSGDAPGRLAGLMQGIDAYYYPESPEGLAMANLIVVNLKPVYLYPDRVRAVPAFMGEVGRIRATAVVVELGYHDNLEDATWITVNVEKIARALVLSVTEFFGLPFLEPRPLQTGRVANGTGTLLRSTPSTGSPAYLTIPGGTVVTIYNFYNGWYTAGFNGVSGYALADDIALE